MDYFRSVVAQDITEADGVKTYNLEVRPTSHLVYTIKCLNDGANTMATVAQILGALEKVEILRFGKSIWSINAVDLLALNCFLLGHHPWQGNVINTDGATRFLSLIIPFGRRLYDPNECFPATQSGELVAQFTIDIADTGYDGYITQLEQVELIGAAPKRYLKGVTMAYTPSATGDGDVTLPRGNFYTGILLWGTTVPVTTAWTTTIDKVKLLANGAERYIGNANWESLHGEGINKSSPSLQYAPHIHLENTATAYTQSADTAAGENSSANTENHCYIDFSPNGDDTFLFDTAPLTGLVLRISAGDTNACRITPVELEKV